MGGREVMRCCSHFPVQTVGAWGFILSALVFCWETQRTWWLPAPLKIGWQVHHAGDLMHVRVCSMPYPLPKPAPRGIASRVPLCGAESI